MKDKIKRLIEKIPSDAKDVELFVEAIDMSGGFIMSIKFNLDNETTKQFLSDLNNVLPDNVCGQRKKVVICEHANMNGNCDYGTDCPYEGDDSVYC